MGEDDDLGEDRPSTSNENNPRKKSDGDISADKSSSKSSISGSESMDVDDKKKEAETDKLLSEAMKAASSVAHKSSRRSPGKVQKRRQNKPRRRQTRRRTSNSRRKAVRRRKPEPSECTIFTSVSSRTYSFCKRCGYPLRRLKRNDRRKPRKLMQKKRPAVEGPRDECEQVGSGSVYLSPLLIMTNATLEEGERPRAETYSEITPEMIYQSVKKLTMWREQVHTEAILQDLLTSYPVNPNKELLEELQEKLYIALEAGILSQKDENYWYISIALENRYITKDHITLFWEIYNDTMCPITNKSRKDKKDTSNTDSQTEKKQRNQDDYII